MIFGGGLGIYDLGVPEKSILPTLSVLTDMEASPLINASQTSFFDISFWQNFVSNSLATLLGALLGIPIALAINRLIERAGKNQKKTDLLNIYKETLEKNKALLNQMNNELNPGVAIFYNVDTVILDSTTSLKYEIINNLELNRRLDTLRYELQHIHRKVELQLDTAYTPIRAMSNYMQIRTELVNAIRGHIPTVISQINEVLKMIDEHSKV